MGTGKKATRDGKKRSIPDEFDHLFGGSQWFSIRRTSACKLLDYTYNKPSFYKRLWMTFAPEESYVTTVLVNIIDDKENIENSNRRYIRWKNENGNKPANLGPEHFFYLLDYDYLFARKIELPVSEHLLELVDRYLLHDRDIVQLQNGGWEYDGYLKFRYNAKFCRFVAQFYKEVDVRKAVDMGCGSGYYVSKWRRAGLMFDGYDANPYTPSLSQHILSSGEKPCGVADLIGETESLGTWDLVVCKDVLQYIPKGMIAKAIYNLCVLSNHYIILSHTIDNVADQVYGQFDFETITKMMRENDFEMDEYMTARIRVFSEETDVGIIYRKRNNDIIIKH